MGYCFGSNPFVRLATPAVIGMCLIGLPVTVRSGQIYRCLDAQGGHIYTDRGCPGQQEYTPPYVPNVQFAPISEAEQERLRKAKQRSERAQQAGRQQRGRRQQAMAAHRVERQRMCAAATQDLRALQARRRQGYVLREQRQLDDRERLLKQNKRQFC